MSLYLPLTVLVNHDTTFYPAVTLNASILDLTSLTPIAYLKSSATTLDSSGHTYGIGTGLTFVNASLGKLKWSIPRAHVTTAGIQWWRLDITDQLGNIFVALYGPLTILAV